MKIKNFITTHIVTIVVIVLAIFCAWVVTWPSSKRQREYLKWEYFSSDTTLVLSKDRGYE